MNASRAARDARAVFEDPNIQTVGGAPQVTLQRGCARRSRPARSNFDPRYSDLSPRATTTMQELSEQIVRSNEPAVTRKLVGTQGGGAQTSTDIDAALKSIASAPSGMLGKVAEWITRGTAGSDLAMRTELSRLLQNPREAAAAIRAAAQAGQPLSQAQEALLEAASRVAAGGTAGLLSAQ